MEPACARLRLSNPLGRNATEIEVDARVDRGSLFLRTPLRLVDELRLNRIGVKSTALPDGGRKECAYVGPLALTLDNRNGFASAIVLGDEVVLGTMTMAELHLVVDGSTGTVASNPRSPNSHDLYRTV